MSLPLSSAIMLLAFIFLLKFTFAKNKNLIPGALSGLFLFPLFFSLFVRTPEVVDTSAWSYWSNVVTVGDAWAALCATPPSSLAQFLSGVLMLTSFVGLVLYTLAVASGAHHSLVADILSRLVAKLEKTVLNLKRKWEAI